MKGDAGANACLAGDCNRSAQSLHVSVDHIHSDAAVGHIRYLLCGREAAAKMRENISASASAAATGVDSWPETISIDSSQLCRRGLQDHVPAYVATFGFHFAYWRNRRHTCLDLQVSQLSQFAQEHERVSSVVHQIGTWAKADLPVTNGDGKYFG